MDFQANDSPVFKDKPDHCLNSGCEGFVSVHPSISACDGRECHPNAPSVVKTMGQSPVFAPFGIVENWRLSAWANLESILAGTEIIRQGTPAEGVFTVVSGTVEIRSSGVGESDPDTVRLIGPGETFGEEGVVCESSNHHGATAVSDCVVARFDPALHLANVAGPKIREIPPSRAAAMPCGSFLFLDVRHPEETDDGVIPGAVKIPLHLIESFDSPDKSIPVVAYCRTGRRSKAAALALSRKGFDAVSMSGGILEWEADGREISAGTHCDERR